MSKGYKGGEFEREISKQLSKWWTSGKRDDVFWRSSQSGGRATWRARKGQTTAGSYGDIAALDPVGEPLLSLLTIELKRGSSHSTPGDLIDFKLDNGRHAFMLCLKQAIAAHKRAGSMGWMIIARRDHRRAIAYIDSAVYRHLRPGAANRPKARVRFIWPGADFVAISLEDFLSTTPPEAIIECLQLMKKQNT